MSWLNIVILLLAGACVLAATVAAMSAVQARNSISHSAYGVARQESRRSMQVAFLRAAAFGVLSLILFGVYGLSARPDDMLSTEPEPMLTEIPNVTMTATATEPVTTATVEVTTEAQGTAVVTPTVTVAPATSTPTVTPTPTITPTSVPSAIVNSEVGLYLRPAPGSDEQSELLPNGTQLTLMEGRQTVDDLEWQQVRAPSGNEGWVAVDFITYQQ